MQTPKCYDTTKNLGVRPDSKSFQCRFETCFNIGEEKIHNIQM